MSYVKSKIEHWRRYVKGILDKVITTDGGQTISSGLSITGDLNLNANDGANEGGQMRINGAGIHNDFYMDNYAGYVRYIEQGGFERFRINSTGAKVTNGSALHDVIHSGGGQIISSPLTIESTTFTETSGNFIITPSPGSKIYLDAPIRMNSLPTSDPSIAGELWNNRGVGIVSTGSAAKTPIDFRGCHIYKTANQSINNANTTTITFSTNTSETYDTDTLHDAANNYISVPSGVTKIKLHATVVFASNATGERAAWFSGSSLGTIFGHRIMANPTAITALSLTSQVISVADTETFTLAVRQSSGGALNIYGTGYTDYNSTSLSIEIIE